MRGARAILAAALLALLSAGACGPTREEVDQKHRAVRAASEAEFFRAPGSALAASIDTVTARTDATPPFDDIRSHLPSSSGDSGGPLLDRRGDLVAINVATVAVGGGRELATWAASVRPDLAWLASVIARDRASR